jgi:hypothetical protein
MFTQKQELVLINFITNQWRSLGEDYIERASRNLSLLKMFVPIVQVLLKKKRELQLEILNSIISLIPDYPIDHARDKNHSFLTMLLKVNTLFLTSLGQF